MLTLSRNISDQIKIKAGNERVSRSSFKNQEMTKIKLEKVQLIMDSFHRDIYIYFRNKLSDK